MMVLPGPIADWFVRKVKAKSLFFVSIKWRGLNWLGDGIEFRGPKIGREELFHHWKLTRNRRSEKKTISQMFKFFGDSIGFQGHNSTWKGRGVHEQFFMGHGLVDFLPKFGDQRKNQSPNSLSFSMKMELLRQTFHVERYRGLWAIFFKWYTVCHSRKMEKFLLKGPVVQ